jgi:RimJ/RimL family protein N-acetyltransferase
MNLLRPWRAGDLASLVANANNRKIWLNLRDLFPHPYGEADGRIWLSRVAALDPPTELAIDREGAAVGGAGVHLGTDVDRASAEIGYWLGETQWGRGLGTAAVRELTTYAFDILPVNRLYARAFTRNAASIALLERLGYRREGLFVDSVIKDGRLESQVFYAVRRGEWKP